ncbi:MAG: dTMP kinase [Candidatus Zixiibacteriota bacterium]
MEKTLFITFEGIDGSGKSTQVKLLKKFLEKEGFTTYTTREPGGTPLAEGLRKVLLDNSTGVLSPYSELFLYLASRREHLDKIILPELEDGNIVISDRFVDSSVAYQGSGRGIDLAKVDELNFLATDGNYPDITFLLDICPNESFKRVQSERGKPLDRLENEGVKFLEKIRNGYIWISEQYPKRIKVIDATLPKEKIFEIIKNHIRPELDRILKRRKIDV